MTPFHEFKIAVARRLGLDPEQANVIAWGDDGHVDVRFHLPVEDIYRLARLTEPLAEWEREMLEKDEATSATIARTNELLGQVVDHLASMGDAMAAAYRSGPKKRPRS